MRCFVSVVVMVAFFLGSAFAQDSTSVQQENSTTLDNSAEKQNAELKEKVDVLKGKFAGLEEDYLASKATVDKLAKIKISGYLQAQIRVATDTAGQIDSTGKKKYDIGEFQGGNLPSLTQTVFQIRRARVKVAYETALTQMVLQLDVLPFTTVKADTGSESKRPVLLGSGVTVKDAYLRFTDPWLKSVALKAGIFDRPFGFEISYSSSMRESPERSRIFQTLFPGERDLGYSLEYVPSENLPLAAQFLNFKGGMFAGNGINIENDDMRDAIGRVGFTIPLNDINLAIDGGVSGYFGKILNRSKDDSLFQIKDSLWAVSTGEDNNEIDRRYYGGDLELFYGNIPFFGGISLRGEYIQGRQPSKKGDNSSPKSDLTSSDPIYLRQISGFYTMVVLNVDPLRSQLVFKYDSFDPNTDLKEKQVTNKADMAYSTIGLGAVHHWDENVKLIAYYDMVTNEETTVKYFDKDVNDNVFTFRVQYKF